MKKKWKTPEFELLSTADIEAKNLMSFSEGTLPGRPTIQGGGVKYFKVGPAIIVNTADVTQFHS